QAEDGIRDLTVTGVQTCALPIFGDFDAERVECVGELSSHEIGDEDEHGAPRLVRLFEYAVLAAIVEEVKRLCQLERELGKMRRRSEERRVGKECRSRWAA